MFRLQMFPESQLRLKFLVVHKSESNDFLATCILLSGNMINIQNFMKC